MSRFEAGERILAIKDEIIELLQEAMDMVREQGTDTERARARSYWYGHIRMSLDNDHGFMGSGITMADTAEELMAEGDADEDEEALNEAG
jgi:hypothetical protein